MSNTETPWGEIGYITYKRTYSRKLNKDSQVTEEFPQTIERVIKATDDQLNIGFTKAEKDELRTYLLSLKGSVAGRFLWQLGTSTVDKLGLLSLQNCAFTLIDSPIRPFTWTFDALMLGSGVGYNLQRKYVYQLPNVMSGVVITRDDSPSADFIVPDTREGWVKLLGKVMKAWFYSGKGFTYSVHCIRSKGAPIKGFGGESSGPEVLCKGIDQICDVIRKREGTKLEPIDCLDIMNIIGSIVVAGNVRRSAQIAIGDHDDIEFLKAKRWDLTVPNWRAMSNNSVAVDSINKLPKQFWETYHKGEPYGLINLRLSRKVGRLGETEYPDKKVAGYNPCAEQSLEDKETCCLAEIFLPNIESEKELFKVSKYLYRINKHSLTLGCHLEETQKIVNKNMRMGIGVTGYLQASDEQRSWLSKCYTKLRAYDKKYSSKHGFPESIKLTTVKPSGTLSLLAGVTPGAHPNPAGPYYIRRVRMAAGSPLIQECINKGYHVEPVRGFDGTEDYGTMVVSFPCSVPEHTPIAGDLTAIEQLEVVKHLQTVWSDNAVSVTIYYKHEELANIKAWLLDNYKDGIKSVSFLLYQDHGFDQAPYETITKDQYLDMKSKVELINEVHISEVDTQDLGECLNGSCPIK